MKGAAVLKALGRFREPIIFAGGLFIGGFGSWIIARNHFDKIAKKEIEEAKAFYSQVVVSGYISTPDELRENSSEESGEDRKDENKVRIEKHPGHHQREERYIDYGAFYPKKEKKVVVDPAEKESPKEDTRAGIEFISPESFTREYPEYSKNTLYYYAIDETLVDDQEEIIDNVEQVVGDAIEVYGMNYGDSETTIWIRNHNLGADYELTKINGSFR